MKKQEKSLYIQAAETITKSYRDKQLNIIKTDKSNKYGLVLFINYLRELRDRLYICSKEYKANTIEELQLTALVLAISEYESWETCKALPKNLEHVDLQARGQEALMHWQSFWDLVQVHLEGWLQLDVAI